MIRAVALCAAIAATPAVAPSAPRTTPLDLSGVRGYQQSDEGALLAGMTIAIAAGLERQGPRQDGLAALVAECVLRTPITLGGEPPLALTDAIEARGASLTYAVGSREVRFYLEATPQTLPAAAALVAAALRAPAFEPATLASARKALAERITEDDGDPRLIGRAMLRASYYRGAAGAPPLGSPATLAQQTPADARAFFGHWYRRGAAVFATVGRTGPSTAEAARTIGDALAPGSVAPVPAVAVKSPGAQPKRIVTQRDVGAPYVALGFAAPAFGERDFAPVLVMRSLLGGIFDRTSGSTLPIVFRSVGALYDYETAPGHFVLWINGAHIDPEVGLAAIATVVKGAAAKPLAASVLARYKESARGEWLLEGVTLEARATAIDVAAARGVEPEAADTVADAIRRVTAADVQRVAKTYFQRYDVALVLPRNGG